MDDTRPRAYEKAQKRAAELKAQRDALQENNPVQTGKPPGAGFESERQRAKTALRDELDWVTKRLTVRYLRASLKRFWFPAKTNWHSF